MIEIKSLSRGFGHIRAVDKISFAVNTGEIVGFLGPNGAGKTTTMRMMVGFLQPEEGSIELDGKSIFADPISTSARIGYLPEHNPLYPEMSVVEFLAYIAALRKMPTSRYLERLDYVIDNCGLDGVLNQRIGTLSKGYKQRVGLAQAILHDPEVLILDEPTSGLDPNQILEIRELIRELGQAKTVLLSSHIMQEVQALCDRVIIINKGRIVVDELKENLGAYMGNAQHLVLEVEADQPDLSDWFFLYPDTQLQEQTQHGNVSKIKMLIPGENDLRRELSAFVVEKGWQILSIYAVKQSLEEIFHNLTMQEELPGTPEESQPSSWENDAMTDDGTESDATEGPQSTSVEEDTLPSHEEEEAK